MASLELLIRVVAGIGDGIKLTHFEFRASFPGALFYFL
jgi:hypothetical protein